MIPIKFSAAKRFSKQSTSPEQCLKCQNFKKTDS